MRAALAIVILLSSQAAAAPFLQYQGDAQRSGVVEDRGPAVDDTALRISLPGDVAPWGVPIILGDHIYVLRSGSENQQIWQINIASAQTKILYEVAGSWPANSLASDGEQLFFVHLGRLIAISLEGSVAWERPLANLDIGPATDSTGPYDGCLPIIVENDRLVVACRYMVDGVTDIRLNAFGLDGQPLWNAPWSYATAAAIDVGAPARTGSYPVTLAAGPAGYWLGVTDHASDLAFVSTSVIDENGKTVDAWASIRTGNILTDQRALQSIRTPSTFAFAGSDDEMYAASWDAWKWDMPARNKDWVMDLGAREPSFFETHRGLAVTGPEIYVMGDDALWKFDATTRAPAWIEPAQMGSIGAPDGRSGILVAGERVYAGQTGNARIPTIIAFSQETGEKEQAFPAGSASSTDSFLLGPLAPGILLGIGEGLLVIHSGNGVYAVGTAPASIHIHAQMPEYPQSGETILLDLQSSLPGAQASDIQFSVEWGDGGASTWSPATSIFHSFERDGEYDIRILARNDAGQTASLTVPIVIGDLPPDEPREPTFLETRFASENQESTFFVLGLMVTFLAASFAAARLGMKRSRLRREIKNVDDEAKQNHHNPLALHRAMAERQEHAKTLLVAGRLDEAQYAVLKGHIDTVAAGGRLESIEQDFPFLPVSLAGTLQRMLDDGRITKWERQTFMQALAADDVLTKGQKAKVGARIDSWFTEDS